MPEQTLDISWEAIIKVLIAGFVLYVLFVARNIIILFFFGLIVSILVEPLIKLLRWFKLPKTVAIILVYLSILILIGLIIYLTAPIFIFELNQFSRNIPTYFEKVNPLLRNLGISAAQNFEDLTSSFVAKLQDSSEGIVKAVSALFGGVSSTLFIFTLAFFISLEERGVEKVLALMVPKKYGSQVLSIFEKARTKIAGWFGARILACVFVGMASLVVFAVLGVKYAFIMALVSGVLNFVPFIGPLITSIIAVLFIGVSDSWLVAAYVLIALTLIQEVENKFITPYLMKKILDLPPILVLMSLLVGGKLFGFLGTLFAVPLFGIIYEFVKELLDKKREEVVEV